MITSIQDITEQRTRKVHRFKRSFGDRRFSLDSLIKQIFQDFEMFLGDIRSYDFFEPYRLSDSGVLIIYVNSPVNESSFKGFEDYFSGYNSTKRTPISNKPEKRFEKNGINFDNWNEYFDAISSRVKNNPPTYEQVSLNELAHSHDIYGRRRHQVLADYDRRSKHVRIGKELDDCSKTFAKAHEEYHHGSKDPNAGSLEDEFLADKYAEYKTGLSPEPFSRPYAGIYPELEHEYSLAA
jgi:hypothetical protein